MESNTICEYIWNLSFDGYNLVMNKCIRDVFTLYFLEQLLSVHYERCLE